MASTEDTPSVAEPAASPNSQPATKTGVPAKRSSTGTKTTPSKASSFMTPTTTTAARSSAGSTLNKPPARPTAASAARKPATGTPAAAGTHRSRPSLASNDEGTKSGASGDEKKASGISKPAKRMSLAAGTLSRAPATKAVSATPDRRSTTQPSPPSERKPVVRASTLSPTKSKASITPASRTGPTTAQRTGARPLTSSLRSAGVSEGKKRLSTIPDSPAVKIGSSEDDKENTQSLRPPLGPRQSTRSVVLQQRMREFELVNEMLQAAIAAEDGEDEEKKEQLENKVSGIINKLKSDLERVRAFEKRHGRMPTEAELLAEAETERELGAVEASLDKEATEESTRLKAELEESQSKIQALTSQIEEMQLTMTELGLAAETEASNVQTAKEALEKKIEDLELRERTLAEQALRDLEDARVNAAQAAIDAARAEQTAQMNELAESHSKEVADLLQRHEEAEAREQSRAQQALNDLEDAKVAAAQAGDLKADELLKQQEAYQKQLDKKDRELTGQSNVIKSLQDELNSLKRSHDNLEAALQSAHEANASELDTRLGNLKQEHDKEVESLVSARDSNVQEIQRLEVAIEQLQGQMQSVTDAKIHEHKSEVEKLIKDHEGVVSSLEAAQDSKEQEILKLEAVREQLQNELQGLRDTKTNEYEAQLQKLKEDHEAVILSIKSDHQDEINLQKSQMEHQHDAHVSNIEEEHQKALDTLADQHEKELKQHKDAVSAAEASKGESDILVDELRAETKASQEAAAQANLTLESTLADLEAARNQVTSLQQVLETLEKENVSRDEHHATLLKKAKSEAEEAATALHESDKSEMALKHETLISELQAQHDESLSKIRESMEAASVQHAKEMQAKDDDLAKVRAEMEAESAKQKQDLTAKHDESLAKIRTDMAEAYAQHELRTRESNATRDDAEQRLQSELSKAQTDAEESRRLVNELQEKVVNAQEEATKSSKLAAKAQEDVRESSKLAAELQDEVNKAQQEAKESSTLAEERQAELAKVQEEAKASSKMAEELQSKIIKTEEVAAELKKVAEELQAKVSKDQETIVKLTAAAEDASKAIEVRNNEDVSKQDAERDAQELTMLKQQLDGALQEVETQRALNDKAAEAAEESKMKIRELEASLKVTEAELTEAKTARTNGTDFLHGPAAVVSRSGNASPGLGDSKWATADTTTPQMTDGEDRGAAIQGTMASMQEEVRQLKEINDDFLEDHARMARLLSHVSPPDSPVNSTPSQSRPVTSGASG